jgi:hypothetical protein
VWPCNLGLHLINKVAAGQRYQQLSYHKPIHRTLNEKWKIGGCCILCTTLSDKRPQLKFAVEAVGLASKLQWCAWLATTFFPLFFFSVYRFEGANSKFNFWLAQPGRAAGATSACNKCNVEGYIQRLNISTWSGWNSWNQTVGKSCQPRASVEFHIESSRGWIQLLQPTV